ncbi:centrosomal protein of 41 kDa-like isoform X1 [Lytechinus variegatus]|uniref:centrosomal protein of 41 kDa-like isoform X1 n=1 Tax=Lytechinus variegatus TaxID=7654 RepID=UPI001BB2AB7E|nr:centrosomal protein of 41 kDa-like isoform X1 [Lytechinus variegatus]
MPRASTSASAIARFVLCCQANMSAHGRTSRPGTRVDILNRKVPENPRYKDVKSVIDTGASLTKHMAKIEDIRKNYRYRNNEIFKRMKVTTFVQLVIQVHSIRENERKDQSRMRSISEAERPETTDINMNGGSGDGQSPVPSLALTEGDFGGQPETPLSSRSTLQSVIAGVGEFDLSGEYVDDPTPRSDVTGQSDCPYLLLDLREREIYEQCHIITAECFPTAMLSRAVNNFTKNILEFKNKPGKIIVIYDEDERKSTDAATTFVQKGFDNLFLLSGGLKVAAQKFPKGLVTGTLPASCIPPPPPKTSRTAKKVKVKTPPQIPADKTTFAAEDLESLSNQLDENLIPKDSGSRLSRATPAAQPDPNAKILSSRSSTSMTSTTVHSSPWK